MDFTTTMRFVLLRAKAEAQSAGQGEPQPEHVFLGILKLSELTADEAFSTSRDKAGIDADIRAVREQLSALSINAADARQVLRRALRVTPPVGDADVNVAAVMAKALERTDDEKLSAGLVLETLLTDPPPAIKTLFVDGKNVAPRKQKKAAPAAPEEPKPNAVPVKQKKDADSPPGKQSAAESLAVLAERVTKMQYALLEDILGQDNAVHVFARGVFNAEVLAAADKVRVQPMAVFVFAGPPGVGKTFLAEQAAHELGLPFKRFDMSGYSDHQASSNLIGMNPSYRDSKPGYLTGFVKKHPKCVALFDEIEKAHINTIHLFLQLLDAGVLHDDYTDENVSFKDALIIFTTNAGQSLYAGGRNTAGIS
jgi:ATP-dependent Clp protease ATP-binding subunit ClpA